MGQSSQGSKPQNVSKAAGSFMPGVRRRKYSPRTHWAHVLGMSQFLGASNSRKRTKPNGIYGINKTTLPILSKQDSPPHPGAVLNAKGKWHNDRRPTATRVLLNQKGQIPNAPMLISPIHGVDQEPRDPSNFYTCEFCYGTGQSKVISPKIYEQLTKIDDSKDQGFYPEPLKCIACAGTGTPPIPVGELLDGKTRT